MQVTIVRHIGRQLFLIQIAIKNVYKNTKQIIHLKKKFMRAV